MNAKKGILNHLKTLIGRASAPQVEKSELNPRGDFLQQKVANILCNWNAPLRDAVDDVSLSYSNAAAKTIEAAQNMGWIKGAQEQSIANILGNGLRLALQPDAHSLGWEESFASAWAKTVERKFEGYARDAWSVDAEGIRTLHGIVSSALEEWFSTGDAVVLLPTFKRIGTNTLSRVRLIPSHRLVRRSDFALNIVQGVELDEQGGPKAYRFIFRQNNGTIKGEEVVQARSRFGRPAIVHVFQGKAGQRRGISPFTPVLSTIRLINQLEGATSTAALLQTTFAATIESAEPTEQVLDAITGGKHSSPEIATAGADSFTKHMSNRADFHKEVDFDLGEFGKVISLFPGENLKFHGSMHPNANYEAFMNMLLREIARCIGLSFEQFTGDYSKASYASIRAALIDSWRITLKRRKDIAEPIYQGVFIAWLDEEIASGRIAFIAQRHYATRATWRGPPRPEADIVKAAKAMEVMKENGWLTDEQAISELSGEDWEETYDQLAKEKELREAKGLPEPQFIKRGVIDAQNAQDEQ
jgi:lambda family phage portal protein